MSDNIDWFGDASSSQPHRPLPNHPQGTSARPNTPLSVVEPSTFYASSTSRPPPLPTRPRGVGSSHTKAVTLPLDDEMPALESEMPPTYEHERQSSFNRVPTPSFPMPTPGGYAFSELDAIRFSDDPHRVPGHFSYQSMAENNWGPNVDTDPWEMNIAPSAVQGVPISGRNLEEERDWWNPEASKTRPGPGMLATVMADQLHDSDHALYSVQVNEPKIGLNPPSSGALNAPSSSSTGSTSSLPLSSLPSSPPKEPKEAIDPPSDEDVRSSVPHPNSYFCPKENGWVILVWKNSMLNPPSKPPEPGAHPLPDRTRRMVSNCLAPPEYSTNKTHHFHKYARHCNPQDLTPPYSADEWETIETVKQKRRAGTIITEDLDLNPENKIAEDVVSVEAQFFDLYICCQCSFYCVASPLIPGVIPTPVWKAFIDEKKSSPQVGKTPEYSVAKGVSTILKYVLIKH